MKNKEGFHSRVTKLELLHVHVATQITTMMHTYLINTQKKTELHVPISGHPSKAYEASYWVLCTVGDFA